MVLSRNRRACYEGEKVIFSIIDNGPGIEDKKLRALYDETTVSSANTGLGLHIIGDLAKAIRFDVVVNSTTRTGTEFRLAGIRKDIRTD